MGHTAFFFSLLHGTLCADSAYPTIIAIQYMYLVAHLMRAREDEKEILCAREMTVERNGAAASQKKKNC